MLERAGAQVRQAESGAEGLAALDEQAADLVFMDIRMPGMDGVETLRHLRLRHGAFLPVVAISASVMAHEKEYYLRCGFDAFLDKPFRLAALYGCLERLSGVEFEYASPVTPPVVVTPVAPVAVPAALAQRCAEAARVYRVTELRRCLEEIAGLGEGGRQLARRLGERVEAYDMEGVLTLLAQEQSA